MFNDLNISKHFHEKVSFSWKYQRIRTSQWRCNKSAGQRDMDGTRRCTFTMPSLLFFRAEWNEMIKIIFFYPVKDRIWGGIHGSFGMSWLLSSLQLSLIYRLDRYCCYKNAGNPGTERMWLWSVWMDSLNGVRLLALTMIAFISCLIISSFLCRWGAEYTLQQNCVWLIGSNPHIFHGFTRNGKSVVKKSQLLQCTRRQKSKQSVLLRAYFLPSAKWIMCLAIIGWIIWQPFKFA